MPKKFYLKILTKERLFDLTPKEIYEIYINNTYKEMIKHYLFTDKELRKFLKEGGLESKRDFEKRKTNDPLNKTNFEKLIKIYDVETLAKKYKCSKRTIFTLKNKFDLKGVEFKKKLHNRRNLTNKDRSSIKNALLYCSIENIAIRYNCNIARVREYIRQLKTDNDFQKIDLIEFREYIKTNNNFRDILKKYKINKTDLLLILVKLRVRLKL
jgi:hypothetical protein